VLSKQNGISDSGISGFLDLEFIAKSQHHKISNKANKRQQQENNFKTRPANLYI
jgi:hypothetical protein